MQLPQLHFKNVLCAKCLDERVTAVLERKRWNINLGQFLYFSEEFLLLTAESQVVLHISVFCCFSLRWPFAHGVRGKINRSAALNPQVTIL